MDHFNHKRKSDDLLARVSIQRRPDEERKRSEINEMLNEYEILEKVYALKKNISVNESALRVIKPIKVWSIFGVPDFLRNTPRQLSDRSVRSSTHAISFDVHRFDTQSLQEYYRKIKGVETSEVEVLIPKKDKVKYEARQKVYSKHMRGPEIFNLEKIQYTNPFGMVLMNIFLSRFVDVIKKKQIDYDIYTTVVQPIRFLDFPEMIYHFNDLDFVLYDVLVCESVILGWLKKSGFYDLDKAFSSPKILTRRCLLLPILFKTSTGKMEGHEISVMWEYNHLKDTYAFYVIDNLPIESYSSSCRNSFNISIRNCVKDALRPLGISPDKINIKDILNSSEMVHDMFSVEGYDGVNYLCTSAARRAALYGARIINIENTDLWNEKDSHEHFALHYNLFIHHMHRMLNWCNGDPAVWPTGKDQPHNTIDAPDPYVLLNDGIGSVLNYMLTLEHENRVPPGEIPEKLIVKLDPNNSYLKLTNVLHPDSPPVKYYFHLGGDTVFSTTQQSEDVQETCRVQSQFRCF